MEKIAGSIPAALLLLLPACGNLLEDNGTHLAYALEKGAAQLPASTDVPGSYLVVSGKTRGGTSYHIRFVLVPRRADGNVSVVELR